MRLRYLIPLLFSTLAFGQAWSGLLAPNRAIDWSSAGAGAIPARATICTTLGVAGQAPTFAQSVTAANIVSALQGCPTNETVLLNPGTYTMTTTIFGPGSGGTTPSNVTLRGSGPQQTILVWGNGATSNTCSGSGQVALCVYNGDSGWSVYSENIMQWTGGYSQGATSITIGSGLNNIFGNPGSLANLHVGSLLALAQCDEGFSSYPCAGTPTDNGNWWMCGLAPSGSTASCTWGGNNSAFPNAGLEQMVTVTGISGSTVSFTPAIYAPKFNSGQSPFVAFSGNLPVVGFGLENMQLNTQTNTASINSIVDFMWTKNSWIKNVAMINNAGLGTAARLHAVIQTSSHVTVRDSYFYGGSPSSDNYAVDFQWATSDSLAENNISQHISSGYMLETGIGNVFGYNYAVDNFFGGSWQQCDTYHHGEGDYYDLFEGHEGICAAQDNGHGTMFGLTYFRSYFSGFDPVTQCPGGGLACYSGTGGTPPKNDNTIAVGFGSGNRYSNIALSVFGSAPNASTYQNIGLQGNPNSCPGYPFPVLFSLNFANGNQQPFSPSCTGTAYTIDNDALVANTLMRWGNYDTYNAAVQTNSGEKGSSAPVYPGLSSPSTSYASYPSLYKSGMPPWWVFPNGTAAPFPAVGPDITGGNIANVGGHVYHNPAANCYLNVLGGQTNGSSGPLPFDASICYPSGSPGLAQPIYSAGTGNYFVLPTVTFTCPAGATCGYTTDGSTPTGTSGTITHGTVYTTPVPITVSGTVLKSIATQSGHANSAETDATYTRTNILLDVHNKFDGGSGTVSSAVVSIGAPIAGDFITCELVYGNGNGASVTSVTDNVNAGAYLAIFTPPHTNPAIGSATTIYYKFNVASAPTTVTATLSKSTAYVGMPCQAWKLISPGTVTLDSAFLQQADQAGSASPNPNTGTAILPAAANELVLSSVITNSLTPGAGTNFTAIDFATGAGIFPQYWIQTTATATNSPYSMGSDAWTDMGTAFQFTPGGGPSTPTGVSVIVIGP